MTSSPSLVHRLAAAAAAALVLVSSQAPAAPAAPVSGASPAATVRHFGEEAYSAVVTAVESVARCSELGPLQLRYSTLAPVFKESSAATTPSTAPAPMTLSRYDEWNGVFATTSNKSANYGLYAFRDPYTPYVRAYWHPGIGIWQYDEAGVGAPFTAIERMDVRIVALDVATAMSSRWCAASGTAAQRRQKAWQPWWYDTNGDGSSDSCPLCETFYQDLVASSGPELVPGISVLGGVQPRTCKIGTAAAQPCWYVDPGRAEGASAWRTLSPDGNGDPTVAPAPLSYPFYVLKPDGFEERHWIKADTGYATHIAARRQLGKNSRPRSTQTGSGLDWRTGDILCDVTAGRGACDLLPPVGTKLLRTPHPDGRVPVVADLDGDHDDDLILYGAGSMTDQIVWTDAPAAFRRVETTIGGSYAPVVADIDGNGKDEVLWYDPAAGTVSRWQWNGAAFAISKGTPGPGRTPLVGDFDGDGADEVHWYAPGPTPDSFWDWVDGAVRASSRNVSGTYEPIVGDLDGNGTDDVLWYGPGTAPDSRWLYRKTGLKIVPTNVAGTYEPVVGDFDGSGADDILWYAPGGAADGLWWGAAGGVMSPTALTVNGTYTPVVADVQGDGRDDMVWYGPGEAADRWMRWSADRLSSTSSGIVILGTYVAVPGRFGTPGVPGTLWYGPSDGVWWR